MNWISIVLGILFLAIFAWRRFRKARILGFIDIILIGLGIWTLFEGLSGLFGAAH